MILVEGLVLQIAMFLPSPMAVRVFLEALPLASLSPPLEALRRLLETPCLLDDDWPQPDVPILLYHHAQLVLTALPVLPPIRLYPYCIAKLERSLRHLAEYEEDGCAFRTFVTKWAHKIAAMDLTDTARYDHDVLCSLLRQCTQLDHVSVECRQHERAVLTAITTPSHRVRSLELVVPGDVANYAPQDAATQLAPWLRSGHATHVGFKRFRSLDEASARHLAKALLSTPSVVSLRLHESGPVTTALIESGLSLAHLTRLEASASDLHRLVPHLDLAKLTHLTVRCEWTRNIDWLVALLPGLTALEDLAVYSGTVTDYDGFTTSTALSLRTVRFYAMEWTRNGLLAVLDWISTSAQLESVSLDALSFGKCAAELSEALRQWILAGCRRVSFSDTNLDDAGLAHIARALSRVRHRTALLVALEGIQVGLSGFLCLLDALATSTYVSVLLEVEDDALTPQRDEINVLLAKYEVSYRERSDLDDYHYLHSPLHGREDSS
ncbi:hypothetical protein SDRG_01166 [Saprolegnia diclina VS20]|uniref:Uncharacterized protein n=1 Tax=Saprolegnia diclina (strain VS20) TaxID=1156394 RepID=T0R4B6_SAPDV|nr:hypothetical protein SDRG_01166 [Saprolegnia diclina VS20]EQC41190.1 hypothetical protein SDRG_01166 [Saprolegnia diclina VS20]|eukprot:XP_008604904.1 hypothetical protein SDRG_01166 [Saprolegnia diclina VS20]